MGPTTTWNMKMDTRGTQTDVVTDRHIADCLMELKSSAEFQDLNYRLSRSCTGEMNLIVTRDNTVGLLGSPFDPVCVTITASGLCYFSVLFAPVEVVDLSQLGHLDLRKFRHILWKLNGRAGYGFCPGFKESDFPDGFQFEAHGLEVLRHPFTRIQAKECRVFLQLRRSSSRAVSQSLGLQLCSNCLKTLTDIYVTLKTWGTDLSLPAFAKFLPSHSHPLSQQSHTLPQQSDSKLKGGDEQLENFVPKSNPVAIDKVPVSEECFIDVDSPEVAHVCEITTDNSPERSRSKVPYVKSESNKLGVRGCMVLLDRVVPGAENYCKVRKGENKPKALAAKSSTSTGSSPTATSVATCQENISLTTSLPAEVFPASSSWSLTPPISTTGTISSARQLVQVSAESSSSRPVLSARIKPFRTIAPHGRDAADSTVTAGGDAEVAESALSEASVRRQGKHETSPEMGPPVLTPEMVLSPGSSPQPLCIDEEADPEELEMATDEPDAKQPCYRCSVCDEAFSSLTDLQQHISQQHQSAADLSTANTTTAFTASDTKEEPPAQPEVPRGKMCPICDIVFSSKGELEKHLTHHHGTVLYPCRYCGQKFAMKRNLANHLERHRGSAALTCQECGEKFTKKKTFAAHVRAHMGSLPYFCTICSKLFSRENVYEEHLERHRARRGVRAVLAGSKKTTQGIMNKARKCLEEKTLKTLPPTAAEATASPPAEAVVCANHTSSPAALSMSTSVSDSLMPPPSNLHLLSAVSLARAELDRQPSEEGTKPMSVDEEMSVAASESISTATQLLRLSPGLATVKPAVSSASSTVTSENHNAGGAQQTLVSKEPMPEESALLQRLNAPLKLSGSPPIHRPELEKHSTPDIAQSLDTAQAAAGHASMKGAETSLPQSGTETESLPNLDPQSSGNVKNEQEKFLAEREMKVKQKEQELKEREFAITRKSMMFFQQLLMAQLSQQSKTGNGGVSGQGKGDKPSQQQALAMFAALNSMATKGMGRRAGAPVFRPPAPGAVPRPEKALPHFHGNAQPPVSGSVDVMERLRKGLALATSQAGAMSEAGASKGAPAVSDAVPQAMLPLSVRAALPHPMLPPFTPVSSAAPTSGSPLPHPKQRPLNSPLRPSPSSSMAPSTSQRPTTSMTPALSRPLPQANFTHGGTFLEELMKLESKMPASAKEFLPSTQTKGQRLRRPRPLPVASASLPIAMLLNETPESYAQGHGKRKSRPSRSNIPDVLLGKFRLTGPMTDTGGKQKKQSRWSGGVVEEKMQSVVTMVSPQEMQRLMALTKHKTPIATTPTSDSAPRPGSSTGQPSPAAPSEADGSSSHAGTATPSPPSPTQSPPGPRSCSTASPPSRASLTPSPSPQPMPHLIPAIPSSTLAAVGAKTAPLLTSIPGPPAAYAFEEAVPMDLTKGSSGRGRKRTGGNQRAEETDGQQSMVLRHVLLDPSVSPDRIQALARKQPPAAEASALSVADAPPTQPGRDFVPQQNVNRQAAHAAMQAQIHAQASSLQAALDPKCKSEGMALLQHFFPGFIPQPAPLASPQRDQSPQRMVLPRFPMSPQHRMALPPQAVLPPPGMLSPRGRVPQQSVWSQQDGVSLPRPPTVTMCSSLPSPAGSVSSSTVSAVPCPAEALPATIGPMRSTAGDIAPSSAGSALSPSGAVPSLSDAVASSSGSVLSPATMPSPPARLMSPNASAVLSRPSVVSPPRTTIPNFLLPPHSEPSDGSRQQSQNLSAKPKEENSQALINPLGGFAWHRPAMVDPFRTTLTSSPTEPHTASPGAVGSDARQEPGKDREREPEIDLADQNLWQQQFLQTLREKRRLQHEQQQRQHQQQLQEHQLLQQFLQANNNNRPSRSRNYPSQRGRGRGRRRKNTNAAEAVTVNSNDASSSVHASTSEAALSLAQQIPSDPSVTWANNLVDLDNLAAASSAGMRGRASRGGRPRGRSRGKGKRNAAQAAPRREEQAEPEQGAEEEGAELRGFGMDVEVKVEPLEAGVRCGGCGKVFFNETDILEHDCDGD